MYRKTIERRIFFREIDKSRDKWRRNVHKFCKIDDINSKIEIESENWRSYIDKKNNHDVVQDLDFNIKLTLSVVIEYVWEYYYYLMTKLIMRDDSKEYDKWLSRR